MGLLRAAEAEFPYESTELESINLLRAEGNAFKFIGRDRKEDCIAGIFQLKMVRTSDAPTSIFNYEEFRAEQSKSPTGTMLTRITQVSNHFSKLEFRPNSKGQPIGFCADTRWNRNLLADVYFDNKFVIEGLLKNTGSVEGVVVKKEMEALALANRAKRQAEKSKDTSVIDRMLNNLTPEQRDVFLKRLVDSENAKRAPIAEPETRTESNNTGTVNLTPQEVVVPNVPKPEGSLKFFQLKKKAKESILAEKGNSLLIEAYKKEFGNKWNSSTKYKATIVPQIEKLLENWTKPVMV